MGEQPELWVRIAVSPLSSLFPLPALFGRRGAWHCGSHFPGDAPAPPPTETVPRAGRSPRDVCAETGTQGERQRPRETHSPKQRCQLEGETRRAGVGV